MASTTPVGSPFSNRNTYTPLGNPRTPFAASSRNPFAAGLPEDSPTSTLTDSVSFTPAPLRSVPSLSFDTNVNGTAAKLPVQIRADPAMISCFDPADKELYDLWAPKR